MSNHLLFKNILYYMIRYNACRWPPPGFKQLQEFNNDSRQILLDLHSIYVKLRICCTSHTPGQRTLAVVAQQAWLSQHRVHNSCQEHTTRVRSNEVYSDVEPACVGLPSNGSPRWCSSRLSRQAAKDESAEARGERCAQRDKGSAYQQMAQDQSEGSSPRPDELATASTALSGRVSGQEGRL